MLLPGISSELAQYWQQKLDHASTLGDFSILQLCRKSLSKLSQARLSANQYSMFRPLALVCVESPRTQVASHEQDPSVLPLHSAGPNTILSAVLRASDLQRRPFEKAALSCKLGGSLPLTPRKLDFAQELWINFQVLRVQHTGSTLPDPPSAGLTRTVAQKPHIYDFTGLNRPQI